MKSGKQIPPWGPLPYWNEESSPALYYFALALTNPIETTGPVPEDNQMIGA